MIGEAAFSSNAASIACRARLSIIATIVADVYDRARAFPCAASYANACRKFISMVASSARVALSLGSKISPGLPLITPAW